MIRKFKNTISILLLMVFLLPSIVKVEHHHEHFKCHSKNEKHIHILHDKCAICSFEFSAFLSVVDNFDLQKNIFFDNYSNNYCSKYYSDLSLYSFSLRAPPNFTNII